jgi:uncharacterized protein YbjT (DUF2867 family)
MKNAIIVGATGMVGGIVLQHCLDSSQIGTVTSLVRRASGVSHAKLREVICNDFAGYDGLDTYFADQDIAYFCLGVYSGQVPDDRFEKITVGFTQGFADMLKKQSPGAVFCFLSASGADPGEKSPVRFARYKGMAENYLIAKGFRSLYLFRPGYIYPVAPRREPNLMYRLLRQLYPLIRLFGRRFSIRSTELGRAMFIAGIRGADRMVLENRDILEIG